MAYDLTVGCTEISKLEGMTLNVLFPELKYNPDNFYLYLSGGIVYHIGNYSKKLMGFLFYAMILFHTTIQGI